MKEKTIIPYPQYKFLSFYSTYYFLFYTHIYIVRTIPKTKVITINCPNKRIDHYTSHKNSPPTIGISTIQYRKRKVYQRTNLYSVFVLHHNNKNMKTTKIPKKIPLVNNQPNLGPATPPFVTHGNIRTLIKKDSPKIRRYRNFGHLKKQIQAKTVNGSIANKYNVRQTAVIHRE